MLEGEKYELYNAGNCLVSDLKPKLKNHYRAHRLSFWLNLVPDLHKPGSDDVPRSHHLLDSEQVSAKHLENFENVFKIVI